MNDLVSEYQQYQDATAEEEGEFVPPFSPPSLSWRRPAHGLIEFLLSPSAFLFDILCVFQIRWARRPVGVVAGAGVGMAVGWEWGSRSHHRTM